ncbi:SDR family oxidoreductase [Frankia tisae]|uniref:SDR family oxidoreductase n=1 Tax=Frankia tisae TaxID=2950104 RepID=UPI0021C1EC42|nr:SDR family oxidoreductase [Frankia tisae]
MRAARRSTEEDLTDPIELIEPRDVSAFLVSDEARMITGSTIAVDAGSMARP